MKTKNRLWPVIPVKPRLRTLIPVQTAGDAMCVADAAPEKANRFSADRLTFLFEEICH